MEIWTRASGGGEDSPRGGNDTVCQRTRHIVWTWAALLTGTVERPVGEAGQDRHALIHITTPLVFFSSFPAFDGMTHGGWI